MAPKEKRPARKYCAYGVCQSTTQKDPALAFIPFPKPCQLFHNQLVKTLLQQDISPADIHKVEDCKQCSKCLTWLSLCQNADSKLRELKDITRLTYICSKHFFSGRGPTVDHPNPLPVTATSKDLPMPSSKIQCPVAGQLEIHNLVPDPLAVIPTAKPSFPGINSFGSSEGLFIGPDSVGGKDPDNDTQKESLQDFPTIHIKQEPVDEPEENLESQTILTTDKSDLWRDIFDFTVTCIRAGWSCEIRNEDFVFMSVDSLGGNADFGDNMIVKMHVFVTAAFKCTVFVLGRQLLEMEELGKLASEVCSVTRLKELLTRLKEITLCCGIWEKKYIKAFYHIRNSMRGRFCMQTRSVRSSSCKLMTSGSRCSDCVTYMDTLRCKIRRASCGKDGTSKFCNNRFLTVADIKRKAAVVQRARKKMMASNAYLRRKMQDIMKSGSCRCKKESVSSQICDEYCCEDDGEQRGKFRQKFLMEQLKFAKKGSAHGYRWDPKSLKWFMCIRNKSVRAYEALVDSGCFTVPSQKTLLNFSRQLERKKALPDALPKEPIG